MSPSPCLHPPMNDANPPPPPRPPDNGCGYANNPEGPIDIAADTNMKPENEENDPPDDNTTINVNDPASAIAPATPVRKKRRPRKKPVNGIFKTDPEKHPCTICTKKFTSWKALFGHMRSHPDREWRGLKPKQTNEKEGSTSRVTVPGVEGDRFRCSGCGQLFTSFYALGGHRASHKGVKGCFQRQKPEQGESGKRAVTEGDKETGEAGGEKVKQAGPSSATARTGCLDLDLNKPALEDYEEGS